jgi:hypothetical protein
MSGKSEYDIHDLGGVAVTKLAFNMGLNQQGQMMQVTHIASETKKIWVFPGKYTRIESTVSGKATTSVFEMAIPVFGWEYERIST